MSHKNTHHVIFYNLKKPESIIIIFGKQYPKSHS